LRTFVSILTFLIGFVLSLLTLFTVLGLGIHRQGASWAIASTATLLVFGPALVITGLKKWRQTFIFGLSSSIWSLFIFVSLPVYFPNERNEAFITGMSMVGVHIPQDTLPREPNIATVPKPKAKEEPTVVLAPAPPLQDHQIALPYEGEGRRLTVELAMQQGDQLIEMDMMLDTGATYTTLPRLVLATLGIHPSEDDPSITLQTANGERTAKLVLIDKLWLGDLAIHGVVVAVCDACASATTTGLLGLNVTGGYNLNIDADRREVVFSTRASFNRHLDVKPFVDISASVSRFYGGRVEVDTTIENHASRTISFADVSIECDDKEWVVSFTQIEPDGRKESQRALPVHDPCDSYQISLKRGFWEDPAP